MRRVVLFALVLLAGVALSTSAQAAFYAGCNSTTVDFLNVIEDDIDPDNLYFDPDPGAGRLPTCSAGDQIDFNLLNFGVQSNNANPGVQQIDGNLLFDIIAHTNFVLESVRVQESGDYAVTGPNPGGFTQASVTLNVRLEITTTDNFVIEYHRAANFSDTTASFDPAAPWQLDEWFLIADILDDACFGVGFFDPATGGETGTGGTGPIAQACGAESDDVNVNIDNTLFAYADPNEDAFLFKKDVDGFGVTVETDPIPEPATAALLAMGLLGLSVAGRRRS